ncbi:nicotinate phosphoribosyltransferase, subgroup A [Campylobacter peloridis]|uniref:Nicotinate phosphoribosyltransferase n=1 Tax=Campylobacter peloridis TaxID=488546 RepID=A0ABX6TSZ1_9BACT|nr:nicotinate phosphoribosyltransferase, subgroup A [Campylobacter peloridis]AJC85107.1 nicotinate phosphoribosyltransferase, subgroup A [Campylobacter peloridis LMG 23910]QOQ89135.1 nicotinate phosphoribosyltransferase, subgroup A [Campylobacter peloridis]
MNFSLLCDFYELSMAYAYFKQNMHKQVVYFEVFFRKAPDNASYAIFCGLEQIINHIKKFSFSKSDIKYLKNTKKFDEDFLNYLSTLSFSGDLFSVKEGECVFASEPLMYIKAPIIEALLLETFILLTLNHQCLIATKANRIKQIAKEKTLLEFGSRRAHGENAALNGARAAFIGGFHASACTLAGKKFKIPISGTMSHAWIQMFDDELSAFRAYCQIYKDNISLLIDTYDYKKGIENAILIFKELNAQDSMLNYSVRIDSGDLLEISKFLRKKLDFVGLKNCKIIASNALDEIIIEKLLKNKAPIDAFGIGEKLITSASSPIFGAVYKLVAIEKNNQIIPKIKISASSSKTTLPHFKKLIRYYKNKKASFDILYTCDENVKNYQGYTYKNLHEIIFKNGNLIYKKPNLKNTQIYCKNSVLSLEQKIKQLHNPSIYKIKISKKLQNLQKNYLEKTNLFS